MKSTGMARKVDDLGRLVLPAEIRRRFGLTEGSYVEIQIDDDRIVLSPVRDGCIFCAATDRLREFRGRRVCTPCVDELVGPSTDATSVGPPTA